MSSTEFFADFVTSQKIFSGEWFIVPSEGKIYNRFHAEVTGTLNDGYRVVGTTWFGRKVNIMCHRAIWIGSRGGIVPDPKMQIDHINGDKEDNRIENLRLVTDTENKNNPATKWKKYGANNPNSKLTDDQVREICTRMEAAKDKPEKQRQALRRQLHQEYQVSITHIRRLEQGKNRTTETPKGAIV